MRQQNSYFRMELCAKWIDYHWSWAWR